MKDLIIVGAGGFGREILDVILDISNFDKSFNYNIKGFIDDNLDAFEGKDTYGFKILGSVKEHEIKDSNVYVCAVADVNSRKKVCESFLTRGAEFINIVHPSSYVSKSVIMGKGNIIQTLVSVASNIKIGDFNVINAFTGIGHDSVIEDYNTIGSFCSISGNTEIKGGVFIANSVSTIPSTVIGKNSRIGVGSVVIRKVKENTAVFGNPATVIGSTIKD